MMKTIYNLLRAILLVLGITACGGGGNPTNEDDTSTQDENIQDANESHAIQMKQGTTYALQRGNMIVRETNGTVLVLVTDIKTGETNATLESGSARIE